VSLPPRASFDNGGSSRGRTSVEIPRLYAEARQSIDIVQRDRAIQDATHKPNKTLVKKAKKKAIEIEEHKLSTAQVVAMYTSNFNEDTPQKSAGLNSVDAEERLKINGLNELTPPKSRPAILKFLDQFTGLFAILLILASILCFVTVAVDHKENFDNIFLAIILLIVVFVNGTITFIEERKGEKVLEGFAGMGASYCTVYRDGELRTLDVKHLVVGDIVQVKGGDKLPADVRVLTANGLKVDNSSLTGEQEPQKRGVECTHNNPLETQNLMFFGTLLIEGEGIGVVIRTGNNTVIGQIANLANTTGKLETPLKKEINSFVRKIGAIAVITAIIFFCIGFAVGNSFGTNFVFAIGIIVANVPQGLIATVTVVLTISAKRLGRKQVVVKTLESVETLGSTTIIASDKTGTLTQNRMTVVDLWYDGRMASVPYDRWMKEKPTDVKLDPLSDEKSLNTFKLLQRCISLCNRAVFNPEPENLQKPILDRKCLGDASEEALFKYFSTRPDVVTVDAIRTNYPKVFEIPFNSKNKWQLSIHTNLSNTDENAARLLLIKGAPERVFAKCSKVMVDGKIIPIDEDWQQYFKDAYEYLASKGERVLGFAQLVLDPTQYPASMDKNYNDVNIPQGEYVFIGLTGLMDPPKVGVLEAISKCKQAGIQVIMVTGDHPITAKAIAKQVGIIEGKTVEDIAEEEDCRPEDVDPKRADAVVLHGEKIDALTDKDWKMVLSKKQIVFSRTSPQQKLQIVERCQAAGHIVAVTGDGVNDSPALKKADLGISMNITGSDVSKEAAAIILMDDNFASIVNGIEEGRLIFDNLKKSIAYTLTHALPEIIPFLANIILSIPLPVSSILIIWIDLGTEFVAAISLAYESAEANIMARPPRSKEDSMVSFGLLSFSYLQMGVIETMACFFSYFVVMNHFGISPKMLPGLSKKYFKDNAPLLKVGNHIYTSKDQAWILANAQSAYFLGIVMVQWMNVYCCKTRINSLLSQGVFRNWVVQFGLVYAAAICCIIFYVPGLNNVVLQSAPISWRFWLPPLPFMLVCFVYDEVRKLLLRRAGWKFLLY